MLFRAATDDDLLAIVRFQPEDTVPPDRELTAEPIDARHVRAFARDPNQLLVIAEDAGEVVGTLQLTSTNSRTDAHRFYERLGFAGTHTGFKLLLDEIE